MSGQDNQRQDNQRQDNQRQDNQRQDNQRQDNQRLFGLRGAISVDENTEQAILEGTRELVESIMERNDLAPEQMVSCVFSATTDLNAQFPAVAARDLGLSQVPLLCTQEIDVPDALPRVIRVLLHYYAPQGHAPQHVYLREARGLRADLEAAQ